MTHTTTGEPRKHCIGLEILLKKASRINMILSSCGDTEAPDVLRKRRLRIMRTVCHSFSKKKKNGDFGKFPTALKLVS